LFYYTGQLSIYHTGSGSDVNLLGTIKGVKSIKHGVVEKNDILYNVLDNTITKIFPMRKIRKMGILGFIIILPFAFPIVAIFSPIESLVRLFKKAPPQYKLEDID